MPLLCVFPLQIPSKYLNGHSCADQPTWHLAQHNTAASMTAADPQQLQLVVMVLLSCTAMAVLLLLQEMTDETLQQASKHLVGFLLALRVPIAIISGGCALALVQAQRLGTDEQEIAAVPRPYAVAAARQAPAATGADMAVHHHLQHRQFEALKTPPPLIRLHG